MKTPLRLAAHQPTACRSSPVA